MADIDRDRFLQLLNRYKIFIGEVEVGYSDNIYEYMDDLGGRDVIERCLQKPWVTDEERLAIKALDNRLRSLLIPTLKPIYLGRPESSFWHYGLPRNIAGELLDDARSDGLVP